MAESQHHHALRFLFAVYLGVFLAGASAQAKTVHYELNIENKAMNMSGLKSVDFALTVNGGIPAPTLEFTEGDDAEIVVKNSLPEGEVSVHWHGILLPPLEDGVPYVNTPPIFAGHSRKFRFPIRQAGTYWYHSHTGTQEQKGVFGAFIIHPKKTTVRADKEAVVILSDWTDENPDQVLRNLKKDGDYYLYKKKNVRSYLGAIKAGELSNHLSNEWQRMGGMDLSDVGYDAFLINGKKDSQLVMAHPGEKVRLRIINAGTSSYFYVSLAGLPMNVISADGQDIAPVTANELLMGMAETYDVLFTVPERKNYEFRATAQDVTGFASAWIGTGEKVYAPNKSFPDPYAAMNHSAHAGHGGHAGHEAATAPAQHSGHSEHSEHDDMADMDMSDMDMSSSGSSTQDHQAKIQTLTVDELQAPRSTMFPADAKVTELKLVLGGDMRRYVWHINGKAIQQETEIPVNEGQVVRITYVNETMMHHPMHLHGHFFRVVNQFGERSPLKHTVDVPPHGTRVVEVYTNEPGVWMLHCHNLYHMHTGMAREFKYIQFKPSEAMEMHGEHDPHLHDPYYLSGSAQAATNRAELNLRAAQTWNEFELRAEATNQSLRSFDVKDKWDFEGDALYSRWFGNYLNLLAGGAEFGDRGYGIVGLGYILPLLIETRAFVNHEGKFRLDVLRHFQWSSAVFSDLEYRWRPKWEGDRESELKASLMYGPSWNWSGGFVFSNEAVGVGAQVKF